MAALAFTVEGQDTAVFRALDDHEPLDGVAERRIYAVVESAILTALSNYGLGMRYAIAVQATGEVTDRQQTYDVAVRIRATSDETDTTLHAVAA